MMENKKVSEKKDSWLKVLLSYTEGSGQRLGISVILSVISIISGLMPYYCIYRGIDLYIRNLNQAPMQEILRWCLYALLFYIIKIVSFSASTWISHIAAYHILEGLRLRLTDRFLKAPLGDVEGHSIGEIKSIMVEKIENMEPPIAHMIPEGSGHILLVILDEATASMDAENETLVQQALSELLQGKTVLVIAHRMRTIANADKVVVLDHGQVVEMGTPTELLEENGLFQRLVAAQGGHL